MPVLYGRSRSWLQYVDEGTELREALRLGKPAFQVRLFLVEVLDRLDVLISLPDYWHWDFRSVWLWTGGCAEPFSMARS